MTESLATAPAADSGGHLAAPAPATVSARPQHPPTRAFLPTVL